MNTRAVMISMICINKEVIKMFNEEQLEDATLNIFEELGYERLNG